jgi:DNA-binding HxlR family transcriptional regulator
MLDQLRSIDTRSGTLIVLLTVNAAGELRFSELYRKVRLDRGSVRRAVEVLEADGLIARTAHVRFPFEKRVRLTRFGSRVLQVPLTHWPSLFFERPTILGPEGGHYAGRREIQQRESDPLVA